MQASPIFCPECGAPAPFRGTAVSLVCEFCSSTIVRSGVNIELIGKVSAIVDNGSPILLNSRGRMGELPFEVVGRLQVRYGRGTWNEWYLAFADGSVGWLADALGQFAIVKPVDPRMLDNVPSFAALQVNQVLEFPGAPALVVDKRAAEYQGAEGVLPFEARPGVVFHAADLRGFAREFITLDYGDGPGPVIAGYSGHAVELETIALTPRRRFEGWPANV